MKKYIECPKCKTENELKPDVSLESQMCRKCWNSLYDDSAGFQPKIKDKTPRYAAGYKGFGENKSRKKRVRSDTSFPVIWFVIASCIALWLVWPESNGKQLPVEPIEKQIITSSPMPKSGIISHRFTTAAIAQLTLMSGKEFNYLVKLESADSHEVLATYFVRSGESFTTKVPLGQYRVRFSRGKKWFGESKMFGMRSEFKRSINPLIFTKKGSEIRGHTIKFGLESRGNLPTTRVRRSEF